MNPLRANTTPRPVRFLIVGVARSGTTLVQRLACEIPDVWVPQETHFWTHAPALAARLSWPLQPTDAREVAEVLRDLPRTRELAIDPVALQAKMPADTTLLDLFDCVVDVLSEDTAAVLGEKTPAHAGWVLPLLARRADLRIISVRRDPRAVWVSHQSVAWGERDPVRLALRWLKAERDLDFAQALYPNRVLRLDHADVTGDPQFTRNQIAGFLDLDGTAVDRQWSGGDLFPEHETWKLKALGDISPASSQWRKAIDPADQSAIESVVSSHQELSAETRLAVLDGELASVTAASHRLPIVQDDLESWAGSPAYRASAQLARATRLSGLLEQSKERAASWHERAERLNNDVSTLRSSAENWKHQAEANRDAAERWRTNATAWRERAEELQEQLGASQAAISNLRERTSSLQRKKAELRRDVAAAKRELRTIKASRRWRASGELMALVRRPWRVHHLARTLRALSRSNRS